MEKFQNKYRIPSARKPGRGYAEEGFYYITICTAHRESIFGHIENYLMVLSSEGEIVNEEWNKSFEIRKELFCEAFIIMPNHLHAILRIVNVETHGVRLNSVGDARRASLQNPNGVAYRSSKSISSFVAGFKSSVTKRMNSRAIWQTRFHDHVIRDGAEFQRIHDYIYNNPARWEEDEFFK